MQITVELKNGLAITGKLHSIDQYLSIKLTEAKVVDEAKYPHMVRGLVEGGSDLGRAALQFPGQRRLPAWCLDVPSGSCSPCCGVAYPRYRRCTQMSVRNCFIRGSVVRYIVVSFLADPSPSSPQMWQRHFCAPCWHIMR